MSASLTLSPAAEARPGFVPPYTLSGDEAMLTTLIMEADHEAHSEARAALEELSIDGGRALEIILSARLISTAVVAVTLGLSGDEYAEIARKAHAEAAAGLAIAGQGVG